MVNGSASLMGSTVDIQRVIDRNVDFTKLHKNPDIDVRLHDMDPIYRIIKYPNEAVIYLL